MTGKELLHYRIIKKLGEGGMGAVYLAEDTRLDRKVALKFLSHIVAKNDSAISRFSQEAKLAASLSHPNIAQVYAIEETEDETFIVFQYIEGLELDDYISQNEVSTEQRITIAVQLADGLLAAHEKGIIHRDIKAGNIMLSNKGQVKILDFGVARLLDDHQKKQTEEQTGTTTYMAPELFLGSPASIKSEVWSYGIVLYQLFSGKLPFDGAYPQAISYAILHEPPASIKELAPGIPEVIEEIILKCLAKKPEDRYTSFGEILEQFEEYNRNLKNKWEAPAVAASPAFKYSAIIVSTVLLLALIGSNLRLFSSTPETKRLAIIPFNNVGENIENMVLLDGILETMTSKISQIDNYEEQLWVIPSSEIISNKISSIKEARTLFGINLAVTGSLQNLADGKRLTINLIDAENLRQLKSQIIDISELNMADLQSESVLKLVQMLDIDNSERVNRTVNEDVSSNAEASAFYLSGKGYLYRYTQENYLDNSINLFKRAINKDPEFTAAYASLGEAFWRKYEQTQVVKYVDSAHYFMELASSLDDELITVKQVHGLLFLGTGNYEAAINVFSEIIVEDPRNESAYSGLADAYANVGNGLKAEDAYKIAIEIKPDYWLGHKKLGNFYINNGEYAKAVAPLQQVVTLTPDNNEGYSNLGVLYYYLSNWEEAIKNFSKSLEIKPTETAASNLGTVHYIQGNYEDAALYYNIAVDINPNNYAVWGNLGSLYGIMENSSQELKMYQKAIEVAENQLRVNPNNITLNTQLAAYYSDVGDHERATDYIEKTLALAPNVPEVSFRLAGVYEKIGNRGKAITLMKKAIDEEYPLENILSQPELQALIADEEFQRYLSTKDTY